MVCQKESLDGEDLEKKITDYASQREQRLDLFVKAVKNRHRLYLEQACPHFWIISIYCSLLKKQRMRNVSRS